MKTQKVSRKKRTFRKKRTSRKKRTFKRIMIGGAGLSSSDKEYLQDLKFGPDNSVHFYADDWNYIEWYLGDKEPVDSLIHYNTGFKSLAAMRKKNRFGINVDLNLYYALQSFFRPSYRGSTGSSGTGCGDNCNGDPTEERDDDRYP
jgi:hypothetical protein